MRYLFKEKITIKVLKSGKLITAPLDLKTLPMSIDLEKKNLENMVYFYATELERVQNGEDPYEILTRAERGRLLDTKILRLGRGETRFELTL